MNLEELLNLISSTSVDDTKLFFITRALKPNMKRKARAHEKYLYHVFQVDNDEDLREYIYETSISQLKSIVDKNYEMVDYDVLNDDTENLFSYPIQNKAFSFQDVVTNQLQRDVPKIRSIRDLENDEVKLWAYCVGFEDVQTGEWVYTFRKMQASSVAIDTREANLKAKFLAWFNPESLMLQQLKGDALTLDKQIDCVFYKDIFYVIKKFNFEQMMGLQEEYAEKAKIIAEEMEGTNTFSGIEKLKAVIETKPSVHKKLVKIGMLGTYKNVTAKDIRQMKRVCKQHGDTLKIIDDKLKEYEPDWETATTTQLEDYYDELINYYNTHSSEAVDNYIELKLNEASANLGLAGLKMTDIVAQITNATKSTTKVVDESAIELGKLVPNGLNGVYLDKAIRAYIMGLPDRPWPA